MTFPWFLSLGVGFLSLSQEILWVRLMSFVLGGAPVAFSFTLTCYLIGIALGAWLGKRFCDSSRDLYKVSAFVLLIAALTDTLPSYLGPIIGFDGSATGLWQVVVPALCIIWTASVKSVLFPIAHHLGSNQSGAKVGSSVSNIYFGNIIGSTLGPLITGFWLLDILTVDQCFRLVAYISLILAVLSAWRSSSKSFSLQAANAMAGLVLVAVPGSTFMYSAADRHTQDLSGAVANGNVRHLIENKHGVIHTISFDGRPDDVIFGGNIYDGRFNTSIKSDSNGINRVYLLAALKPKPKRVLVVGMSGGAWTQVLRGFPGVESIDVVEINPGYLDLIRRYPLVASVLDDPRLQVHVDDGRRWLKRNPTTKFDLIVMNNTYYWRAYSTNLLSQEFMRELRSHMKPGSVLAFNSTTSLDPFMTVATVFPYTYRFGGFAYAGATDFRATPDIAKSRLMELSDAKGQPVFFESDFDTGAVGYKLAHAELEPVSMMLQHHPDVEIGVITDANMLSEYRHGKRYKLPLIDKILPNIVR